MIKSTVDPECTGQFSSLFLDYIQQKPSIRPFYNQFPKIENFEKLIKNRGFSDQHRGVLASALEKQYEDLAIEEFTFNQIDSLKSPKTFTVTTGHQLNLFTGPLYFVYKIVSTINLAEKLQKAYPDFHFIPVYWMATEDHDFDEINYFKLDGKKYQWDTHQTGPVGAFVLDDSFQGFFKEVAHFVPELFKQAYLSSKSLSQAVRKYVHALFGHKGLLIVDGNDMSLKRMFLPMMKEDLISHRPFELAQAATSKLESLGYHGQIYPREINLFYMEGQLRERIEKQGEDYQVLNTKISFSKAALLEILENHPERFSPNVVLRPVYQECILPNLAYLGGPAEVAYWLQLKGIFDQFDISFPAVMPRNFAVVLDHSIQRKIDKLALENAQLFQPVENWKKEFVIEKAELDISLNKEKEAIEQIMKVLTEEIQPLDRSLSTAFEAGKVRMLKILDQLSGKVRKFEERKLGDAIRQREEVQQYLYPGGSPQERVENMMRFYLEDELFIEKLFPIFDPLNFDFMILKK
jgi:bacillithiol biosynthesis cysteine-adding enzyme BshC